MSEPEILSQGGRALVWVAMYLVAWILMGVSCEVGLPGDCRRASDPLEVLTELPVLLAFGLAQAWLCDVTDEKRFTALAPKVYFPAVLVVSALLISAFSRIKELRDLRETDDGGEPFDDDEVRPLHIVVTVCMLVLVALGIGWHFLEAWRLLPGAHMISGLQGRQAFAEPPEENPLRDYLMSRMMIVMYLLLYIIFVWLQGGGWGYHYILLAWVLSLMSRFTGTISVLWLAITTGVFLQGIGAYSVRFLCFHT